MRRALVVTTLVAAGLAACVLPDILIAGKACDAEGRCGFGLCVDGTCIGAIACVDASTCGDGEACIAGACLPPCDAQGACGDGERCVSGACVADVAPPPPPDGGVVVEPEPDAGPDPGPVIEPGDPPPDGCTAFTVGAGNYLFCVDPLPAVTASATCQVLGGTQLVLNDNATLADDLAEEAAVQAEANALAITSYTLGVTDRAVQDTYVWEDGSTLARNTDEDRFAANEPERDPNGGEDCVELVAEGLLNGSWNDEDCTTPRAFYCESLNNDVAPPDCTRVELGERTYLRCTTPRGRLSSNGTPGAFAVCQAADGHLATFDDEDGVGEQLQMLADMARSGLSRVWIGLDDRANENSFVWLADKGPLRPEAAQFSDGEPSNSGERNCVVGGDAAGWRSSDCDIPAPYVCELGVQ
jgi:hypothetical protein